MPYQASWLYTAVVEGEKVTLAISKKGKDFTYCVHINTEPGSRFHVQTSLSFLKWQ